MVVQRSIALIRPADVCAKWALGTRDVILGILEICAAIRILHNALIHAVRREFYRRTIAPTTDELGGELFFCEAVAFAIAGSPVIEKCTEGTHTLPQFAIDHEGAIRCEQVWHWRDRKLTGFIGIA